MRIAVGIHLHSDPDRLSATLAHVRAATTQPVEILLLGDGPDAPMREALAGYGDLRQSTTDQLRGAAACFNRLLRSSDAELLIFLEAGCLVGPEWLELLLAALGSDPRNGLAGPSTNRSWNMQAAFPNVNEADIARTAVLAKARFGESWRTFEPLHCLADFCYAVRRVVVEAIGGADEEYGAGPCWEMDYTVRAVRAGFQAVWAQSAFVYRRPFTERRRLDEVRLMEASKRHYQDKFCGPRLSGERTGYVGHCRGDRCTHFAPPDRIRVRLPIADATAPGSISRELAPANPRPVSMVSAAPDLPLVSCIMPTRDRCEWMLQAVAYFQRQDYCQRELIIIDDGQVDHSDDLPCDPRIRYVHMQRKLSIGMKRNRACQLARGQIIAHWDDDDWYASGRLSAQVAPLLAGAADVTGLARPRFFELGSWEFWNCTQEMHRRLFVLDVHGGTLVFRRHLFERLARYPDSSLAEDAQFLKLAVDRGARLQSVPAGDLFLYVRHGRNAWAFSSGQYLDPRGWQRVPEPDALAPDREFYAKRSSREAQSSGKVPSQPAALPAPIPSLPLVSCIMPTYNRRAFVPKAIEYFLRQDYPNRELIIVDDGDDCIRDLVPNHPSIRYLSLPQRIRLGTKRNKAVEMSRGEIIVHWDDDDWMDPRRVSHQVSALLEDNADICGTSSVCFYEVATSRLSLYRYPKTQKRWLYGASLCYRRTLWQQKPFEPLEIGEDTRFVWAPPQGRVVDIGDFRALVAIVHSKNTSTPRPLSGAHWSAWRGEGAEQIFGPDWAHYLSMRLSAEAHAPLRAGAPRGA